MKHTTLTLALLALSASALAQMSPIGTWRSIDDATKEAKAEIVISDNNGTLTGKITKLLRAGAAQDGVCTECTDDRKGKAIIGLEIIRGAKKTEGKEVWEGGKVLDAESGKNYSLKMTPIEGGAKLEVRGSILFVGRTQVWQRVN